MDPQGSTPDNPQGGQPDLSPQNQSADNAAEFQQPSQDENQSTDQDQLREADDQAYGNDNSGDAPSQTTDDDDQPQGTQQPNQADDSTADDDLKKWASSQNISLETPTEIALAKRLRDTQKAYHQKNQNPNKQELDKPTQSDQDPVAAELRAIQSKLARSEFFESHPDARELEGEMYDAAIAARDAGDLAGFEYYKTPQGWNTLYQIVKAQSAETASNESYETGRKDERTNLAKKQQAAAPNTAAVNPAPGSTQITDKQIGEMSLPEYEAFRKNNPDWNPFSV